MATALLAPDAISATLAALTNLAEAMLEEGKSYATSVLAAVRASPNNTGAFGAAYSTGSSGFFGLWSRMTSSLVTSVQKLNGTSGVQVPDPTGIHSLADKVTQRFGVLGFNIEQLGDTPAEDKDKALALLNTTVMTGLSEAHTFEFSLVSLLHGVTALVGKAADVDVAAPRPQIVELAEVYDVLRPLLDASTGVGSKVQTAIETFLTGTYDAASEAVHPTPPSKEEVPTAPAMSLDKGGAVSFPVCRGVLLVAACVGLWKL